MITVQSNQCPCDTVIFPAPLKIPAGLTNLPRQIGMFGDFRNALLREIHNNSALAEWNARNAGDLGVMLFEMWAYICDNVSFYDKLTADETYIGTAQTESSLRKLVGLIGYRPRPATSAQAFVAAIADGLKEILVPQGVGFRSGAFDDEAPQVFEVTQATTIHPLHNKWRLPAPPPGTVAESYASDLDLASASSLTEITTNVLTFDMSATIAPGDYCIVSHTSDDTFFKGVRIASTEEATATDGVTYKRATLDTDLTYESDTKWEDISVKVAGQKTSLWTQNFFNPQSAIDGDLIVLNALTRQIKTGDLLLLEKSGDPLRPFRIANVSEESMMLTHAHPYDSVDVDGNDVTLQIAPVFSPITHVTLDADINDASRKGSGGDWSATDASSIVVHYLFEEKGKPTTLPFANYSVAAGGTFSVKSPKDFLFKALRDHKWPARFLVEDQLKNGADLTGYFDPQNQTLTFDPSDSDTVLIPPLKAYGNIVYANRGETVDSEVLGSGNAAIPHQQFALKKSPLTYHDEPSSVSGVAADLTVWVNGIAWDETPSFFNHGPTDRVYIVRQNDDDENLVTFGDGIRGSRLETGTDNVIASYRYGSGEKSPPAGSLNQLAKPFKGLNRVHNVNPSFGGADKQDPENLRLLAPASALLLGRAVSLKDFEVAAQNLGGVIAARATWQWHGIRQQRTIHIAFIGDEQLEPVIEGSLRDICEDNVSITAEVATPEPTTIAIDTVIDPSYREDDVLDSLCNVLVDERNGCLIARNIGIGQPLMNSVLTGKIMSVSGVTNVDAIMINDIPLPLPGIAPDPNGYFSIESGMLSLNGVERSW
jgi:hypothetical protein